MRIPIMIYIYKHILHIHINIHIYTYIVNFDVLLLLRCCCSVIYLCPFRRDGKHTDKEEEVDEEEDEEENRSERQEREPFYEYNVNNFMLIRLPTNNSMHICMRAYICVYVY